MPTHDAPPHCTSHHVASAGAGRAASVWDVLSGWLHLWTTRFAARVCLTADETRSPATDVRRVLSANRCAAWRRRTWRRSTCRLVRCCCARRLRTATSMASAPRCISTRRLLLCVAFNAADASDSLDACRRGAALCGDLRRDFGPVLQSSVAGAANSLHQRGTLGAADTSNAAADALFAFTVPASLCDIAGVQAGSAQRCAEVMWRPDPGVCTVETAGDCMHMAWRCLPVCGAGRAEFTCW